MKNFFKRSFSKIYAPAVKAIKMFSNDFKRFCKQKLIKNEAVSFQKLVS